MTVGNLSLKRAGAALVGGGAVIALVGVLAIVATGSWALIALGVVAVVAGAYVLLVGLGLIRAQAETRRQLIQRALDENAIDEAAIQLVAEAPAEALADCDRVGATACAACDDTCALAGLRH